jgi:hypothetical protein
MFKTKDEDYIDLKNITDMTTDLNVTLTDSDIMNMSIDLDLNKDGKISFDEFKLWWLSGRRGVTGTMSRILLAKLGSMTLNKAVDKGLEELCKKTLTEIYE